MHSLVLSAAKTQDVLICIGPPKWDSNNDHPPAVPLGAVTDCAYSQYADPTFSPIVRLSRYVVGPTTLENEFNPYKDQYGLVGLLFIARNDNGIVRASYYENCKQTLYEMSVASDQLLVREDISFTCSRALTLDRTNAPGLDWDTPAVQPYIELSAPKQGRMVPHPQENFSTLQRCDNTQGYFLQSNGETPQWVDTGTIHTATSDLSADRTIQLGPEIQTMLEKLVAEIPEGGAETTTPAIKRAVLTPRERVAAERKAKG